ncbi:MAG TPA: L-histidine N(alpha)-methyltransferase [Gemmatimonadaceae bacterium]|jgi:L-histidine N-alpha-methyltransferase|nr:L-histidine N(alpha)-methyltransferase [Gemmatimonadaceae bacterium]
MSSLARAAREPHRRPDPAMLAEVRAGLARPQKELSPKYFYDHRGSVLFEEITRLPEYYLTRAERAILRARVPGFVASLHPRSLVELGAGAAEKTRIILDAMMASGSGELYVPVDVSAEFLEETTGRLRRSYPSLHVEPWIADIGTRFELPRAIPRPALFALLGSTIGNFDAGAAGRLLRHARQAMRPEDRFLLGADLLKDPAVLEAAYNDAGGVTAEFNRNVLRVLNRELGADFDVDQFAHRAIFDADLRRIEMHLVSRVDQRVGIPGIGTIPFRKGETIRTEISCKYDRASVEEMLAEAGMRLAEWWNDDEQRFALAVGARA